MHCVASQARILCDCW